MVTKHAPLPLHAPLQPVKLGPAAACWNTEATVPAAYQGPLEVADDCMTLPPFEGYAVAVIRYCVWKVPAMLQQAKARPP